MLASGSNKSLRYSILLVITPSATLQWTQGNISLGDGANIYLEGILIIDTTATNIEVFVGEAQLLQSPNSLMDSLLYQESGRNWHR